MPPQPDMSPTFSTDTRVTLWFPAWTTTTPLAYTFTLLLLFTLGILNRFLAALRAQLDRRWTRNEAEDAQEEEGDEARRRLLASVTPDGGGSGEAEKKERVKLWVGRRFCWRREGTRALLEFSRVLVAYVLMLAVMTYQLGFFFAVTGSVLVGELIFGRFG